MSGKFVRASKFRHVIGTAAKKENTFSEVASTSSGEGNFIKGNATFLAVGTPGGGGPVIVHNVNDYGRFGHNHPVLNVHKSVVVDFDFNPFIDSMLATASEDCTAKISIIPKGGLVKDQTDSVVSLAGHQKKLSLVHFHPTASNVLGTAGYDHVIKIWDIEKGAEVVSIEGVHEDLILSFEFNEDGSLLATTCKDKNMRVFDPRDAKKAVQIVPAFDGTKSSRAVWFPNLGWLGGVGFSKGSNRQIGIWDPKNLKEEVTKIDIDQAAGVIMPFYDPDTGILYLAGKGDGNIRYYEITNEKPHAHYISDFRANEPQKGVALLPKRIVDTSSCEIARFLRMGKTTIVPISFTVPRTESDVFQKDLYPDTYAATPALTAADWAKGVNKPPVLQSMAPGANKDSETKVETTFVAKKSYDQLEAELAAALKRIAELEAAAKK